MDARPNLQKPSTETHSSLIDSTKSMEELPTADTEKDASIQDIILPSLYPLDSKVENCDDHSITLVNKAEEVNFCLKKTRRMNREHEDATETETSDQETISPKKVTAVNQDPTTPVAPRRKYGVHHSLSNDSECSSPFPFKSRRALRHTTSSSGSESMIQLSLAKEREVRRKPSSGSESSSPLSNSKKQGLRRTLSSDIESSSPYPLREERGLRRMQSSDSESKAWRKSSPGLNGELSDSIHNVSSRRSSRRGVKLSSLPHEEQVKIQQILDGNYSGSRRKKKQSTIQSETPLTPLRRKSTIKKSISSEYDPLRSASDHDGYAIMRQLHDDLRKASLHSELQRTGSQVPEEEEKDAMSLLALQIELRNAHKIRCPSLGTKSKADPLLVKKCASIH